MTALDFLQSQRRRQILMQDMAAVMDGVDMYVTGSGDVRLTNQTGHPAVVLPYDFGGEDHQQPICTTIIGNLFEDDRMLSLAHAYQTATDWHTRRPDMA